MIARSTNTRSIWRGCASDRQPRRRERRERRTRRTDPTEDGDGSLTSPGPTEHESHPIETPFPMASAAGRRANAALVRDHLVEAHGWQGTSVRRWSRLIGIHRKLHGPQPVPSAAPTVEGLRYALAGEDVTHILNEGVPSRARCGEDLTESWWTGIWEPDNFPSCPSCRREAGIGVSIRTVSGGAPSLGKRR